MKEEDIFAEALGKPSEDRSAFLREACGDDDVLRGRVERLLRSHEEAGTFLAEPVGVRNGDLGSAPTIDLSPEQTRAAAEAASTGGERDEGRTPPGTVVEDDTTGDRVLYFGEYQLVEEIARGAMGVVYRALQASLQREVALKMIRGTLLASDTDVQRFKAEAEAAASLDHPNIVPIYEIGEYEEQHYFSMKLVEGGTLHTRMDEIRKSVRAAVRLLATTARAVHAAHQRGILHRDLKPGNILVDEAGEPHVTDFGLAKQMESESSLTVSGQVMGTPYYMSPEQACGGELTTGVDVYALGAILYEILTGRPPHKGETMIETLRLAVDVEPEKPRAIDPAIDRDLETIALKCLEKDPAKRYASAQGLVNDLEHWLAGEPILARPVGTAEKAVKWMKRKPVHAASAGLAVLFLLTLGIGGPMAALKQAALKRDAEGARADEAEQRKLAEEQADEAREVMHFFKNQIVSWHEQQKAGAAKDVETPIVEAVENLEANIAEVFDDDPLHEAAARKMAGQLFGAMEVSDEAIVQLEQALALRKERRAPDHPDTLIATVELAKAYLQAHRDEEVSQLMEESIELIRETLGVDHPSTIDAISLLAASYRRLGRLDSAIVLQEEYLELLREHVGHENYKTRRVMVGLVEYYLDAGRDEEALEMSLAFTETTKVVRNPKSDDVAIALFKMAQAYQELERNEEALALMQAVVRLRMLSLGPSDERTASALAHLRWCYVVLHRYKESLLVTQEIARLRKTYLGEENHRTLHALLGVAHHHRLAGQFEEARNVAEHVVNIRTKNTGPKSEATIFAKYGLARYCALAGDLDRAIALMDEVYEFYKARQSPAFSRTVPSGILLARFLCMAERFDGSIRVAREALGLGRDFSIGEQEEFEPLLQELAKEYRAAGKNAWALEMREARLAILHRNPARAGEPEGLALEEVADSLFTLNRRDEGFAKLKEALELAPKKYSIGLKLGGLLVWYGQEEEWEAFAKSFLEQAEASGYPNRMIVASRAALLRSPGDPEVREVAIRVARRAAEMRPDFLLNRFALGMAELREGNYAAADEVLQSAVTAKSPFQKQRISKCYRAIARFHLGDEPGARLLVADMEKRKRFKAPPGSDAYPFAGPNVVIEDLMWWLAYREAKDLLPQD